MRLTAARIDRLMERVRELKATQAEEGHRITRVVVELPSTDDFPISSERLIFPAVGRRPSLTEVAV